MARPTLLVLLAAAAVRCEGEPEVSSLVAEHRGGKAAEPEPFLDRIASLFSGVAGGVQDRPAQKKAGPRPLGPVYRPPGSNIQKQSSIQRPVAVRPPQGFPPAFTHRNDNGLQSAPSNIRPQVAGSKSGSAAAWSGAQPANMAQIKDLQVQCEKDLMRVRIMFDRPFYGMVFSKGYYSNVNCVHVPASLGQTQATFDIAMGQCGMSPGGNTDSFGSPNPQGSFIENTVIIQYDPLLQEVWDQARKIRCTWYDFYEKAVTFKPYQVDMLDPVTANFLGDNLRCWMQIQVGKGPYASEVSGIVKIGQTMTMVLGVKDDENKFDMMVRNCVAHDGQRAPIQLVDEKGCVVREKIMSPFKKVKNFDATANVLSYAYFQAFKFPDSMNVHFQCVVQVCRSSCPEPQCGGAPVPAAQQQQQVDSYGAPAAPPVSIDSYGSPAAGPISPRGAAGSNRRVAVVRPEQPGPAPRPIPLRADSLTAPAPGYTDFNKRVGVAEIGSNGGRPRSLEFGEGEEAAPLQGNAVEREVEKQEKEAEEGGERRRREAVDSAGNRVLRVRREAEEDAVSEADIQTERVIRVVSPTDVQFKLAEDEKDEVVINLNSVPAEALCLDTAAFVGVTITFLMLLIIAAITIVFLWLRIRAIDRKNLL